MSAIHLCAAFSLGLNALAQSGVAVTQGGLAGAQGVRPVVRIDAPSQPPWARQFSELFRSTIVNHSYVGHRSLYDTAHKVYLGYDLLLEPQQQPDAFRISFYDTSLTALDLAGLPPDSWTRLAVTKLPPPGIVHVGDVISIELWQAPDTGQKIIDDLRIDAMLPYAISGTGAPPGVMQQASQRNQSLRQPPPPPAMPGAARAFTVGDAELHLYTARLSVNGAPYSANALGLVTGTLVWFYLPGRGRFIFSVAARPELGFTQAGELRGGRATFKLGNDSFVLDSSVEIASASTPLLLYLLHDPDWQPSAQSQRDTPQIGSVDPKEIEALQRK